MGPTKNKIHCRWKKKRAEAKWQVDPITTGCGRDQNQMSEVSLKPRKQVVGTDKVSFRPLSGRF